MDKLSELAVKYGTDKWNSHYYTQHYEDSFLHLRNKEIKLLEIGVGGYEHKNEGGNSLRMWKDYFPKGEIYAFDIEDKSHFSQDRITILKGDQYDSSFLEDLYGS